VVVVSFNTVYKLRRCLACIEPEHEVIVVDNGSNDGSPELVRTEFPAVKMIENSGNVGFGAANNQGIDLASRELVLFLNSDCYASPGAVGDLATLFEDERVVAAGGELINPDGTLQESVAGRLTLGAVFLEQTYLEQLAGSRRYWRTGSIRSPSRGRPNTHRQERDATEPPPQFAPLTGPPPAPRFASDQGEAIEVEQVMGACLMIRPVVRFDERFFLYCEDTDLCLRLRQHGRILYAPGAIFTHELGSSSPGPSRWLGVARYNRGKELYFAIHHGPAACAVCWLLDRLGAFLRLVVYVLLVSFTLGRKPNFTRMPLLWLRVLTASPRGPDRPPRKAG